MTRVSSCKNALSLVKFRKKKSNLEVVLLLLLFLLAHISELKNILYIITYIL